MSRAGVVGQPLRVLPVVRVPGMELKSPAREAVGVSLPLDLGPDKLPAKVLERPLPMEGHLPMGHVIEFLAVAFVERHGEFVITTFRDAISPQDR